MRYHRRKPWKRRDGLGKCYMAIPNGPIVIDHEYSGNITDMLATPIFLMFGVQYSRYFSHFNDFDQFVIFHVQLIIKLYILR